MSAIARKIWVERLQSKEADKHRTSSEEDLNLQPLIDMTLEKCLGYIGEDELIEVTPRSIRMRKRVLTKY